VPVSAVDCVGPAIQHTRDQLFRNFRFSQWARLALVGILAAEVHSGGCSFRNFNIPMNRPRPRGDEFLPTNFPHIDPAHLGQYLGLIAIAALLAVALIFVFLYISSVFRFILFASVLQKNCSIGEGWRRWQRTGGRFFLWQLVFQIVAGMFFLLLIGLPFAWAFGSGWAEHAKEHLGVLILGGIFLAGLVLFSLLVAVVIQVLAKDFLVPIMALEDLDFADGWNRLLPIVSNDFGKFVIAEHSIAGDFLRG